MYIVSMYIVDILVREKDDIPFLFCSPLKMLSKNNFTLNIINNNNKIFTKT